MVLTEQFDALLAEVNRLMKGKLDAEQTQKLSEVVGGDAAGGIAGMTLVGYSVREVSGV